MGKLGGGEGSRGGGRGFVVVSGEGRGGGRVGLGRHSSSGLRPPQGPSCPGRLVILLQADSGHHHPNSR